MGADVPTATTVGAGHGTLAGRACRGSTAGRTRARVPPTAKRCALVRAGHASPRPSWQRLGRRPGSKAKPPRPTTPPWKGGTTARRPFRAHASWSARSTTSGAARPRATGCRPLGLKAGKPPVACRPEPGRASFDVEHLGLAQGESRDYYCRESPSGHPGRAKPAVAWPRHACRRPRHGPYPCQGARVAGGGGTQGRCGDKLCVTRTRTRKEPL